MRTRRERPTSAWMRAPAPKTEADAQFRDWCHYWSTLSENKKSNFIDV